jgi:hypothetical protein
MPFYYRDDSHPTSGFYYRDNSYSAVVLPSISGVAGTYAPGNQLVITTANIGTITSVTLGGETLTIDATATNEVTATIPAWIEIAAGATVSLVVGDGADTATLAGLVFQIRSGATSVGYVAPGTALDPAETESFYELIFNQYGYALVTGDQLQLLTVPGLTVNPDSSFVLANTNEITSTLAVFRDATQDWLTGPNSPTDYWLPYSIQEPDDTPDALVFTAATNAPLSSFQVSNEDTIEGFNEQLTISITNGSYSINSGSFTSSTGVVDAGDSIAVRVQASANYASAVVATLTTGSVQHTYSVTTLAAPADTTPDAFSFTPQTDVETNTVYESNVITVTGINAASPITIAGGGRYRISTDGGTTWSAYTSSAGTVNNNNQVQVDNTSSVAFSTAVSTTLTIGGVPGTFSLTTRASDTTPNPFTFTDVTNAALSTLITSDTLTITGITDPASISVSGGGEYSINSGAWTSAATTISSGQNVRVRITSSALNSTAVNAVLTIGGVSDTFTVTTESLADTTPDGFTFPSITDVALSTVIESAVAVISGINAPSDVTVSNGEYQIGAGAWTSSPGTISNGQQIRVRQTSSASETTSTTAVLTIGGVSANFVITTRAEDTTPNPFTFTDVTGATVSTVYESNTVTITGILDASNVSVSTGAEVSINGGSYTSSPGTITNNQTIQVRITSSATGLTAVNATVTVGGISDMYTVTTEAPADTTPNAFSFSEVTNAPASTVVQSSAVIISGIDAATAISITGGEYQIGVTAWRSDASTITNGQQVRVRQTSSASELTTTTATLNIGGVTADFDVTTADFLDPGDLTAIEANLSFYPYVKPEGSLYVIYEDNATEIRLHGVRSDDEQEITTLSVIAQVTTLDGVNVGSAITLTHDAQNQGNYEGDFVPSSLQRNRQYILTVTCTSAGTLLAEFNADIVLRRRGLV